MKGFFHKYDIFKFWEKVSNVIKKKREPNKNINIFNKKF